MHLPFGSIRLRLALWYAAALAAIILVFAGAVYYVLRADLMGQLHTETAQNIARIEMLLSREPGNLEELEEYGSVGLYRVDRGGSPIYRSTAWEHAGLNRALSAAGRTGVWTWETPADAHFSLQATRVRAGGQTYQIATAESADAVFQSLKSLLNILLIGVPCALAFALAGGYLLAGRMLAPLDRMATKARRITAERLSERIPVENSDDELGRLAVAFNDTLARLEDAFERLRQFTADASHELRTPLTSLRSVGEVALQKANGRPSAFYREVIGSMLEEADRLARLVGDLLTLTRSDTAEIISVRKSVNLEILTRSVIDHLSVLAEEKSQRLELRAEEIILPGDPETLRLILVNLIDNAIKYTPEGGRIDVRIQRAADGHATVQVRDEGPGILPEHTEHIFERFYRVDEGRSREAGGSGLGLAIARRAARLNGGRIELESTPGKGSCFMLVLPSPEPASTSSQAIN